MLRILEDFKQVENDIKLNIKKNAYTKKDPDLKEKIDEMSNALNMFAGSTVVEKRTFRSDVLRYEGTRALATSFIEASCKNKGEKSKKDFFIDDSSSSGGGFGEQIVDGVSDAADSYGLFGFGFNFPSLPSLPSLPSMPSLPDLDIDLDFG